MKILYFAELRELLNQSTETIHLDTTLTVQEFESYLLKHHSELKSKKFQIAVNEEFVRQDDIVQPGDTIALIPPVSGGCSSCMQLFLQVEQRAALVNLMSLID